jgi:folate-binding protein YgfZ
VAGPDAASYLERMLSNEIETLDLGDAREALLLNPKARVIATTTVWRRGPDDFLLLTEPELGERLRAELTRYRFAAKASIELEPHLSTLVLGGEAPGGAVPNREYGEPAYELLDADPPAGAEPLPPEELELLRIRAATPRMGREIDDRVLPAEAGLDTRAISFTKGCYPGQEPVARLHFRGHVNRELRRLAVADGELPERDEPLLHDGKEVGRVTSAARDADGTVVALAYVRREVPREAPLALGARSARQLP